MAALAVQQAVSPSRLLQSRPQILCKSQTRSVALPLVGCPKKKASKGVPAVRFSALPTLAAWDGKSHMGSTAVSVFMGKPGRRPLRGVVTASLFGVGAPEALVIGVVALLVFGPKGLAEVARNLGKTLKTFQPTIKELQDVSREFRSTLEQEIGLDELRDPYRSPPPPIPPQQSAKPAALETADKSKEEDRPSPKAYTTDEMLRVTEEQAKQLVSEEKRKAAEAAAWGGQAPSTRKEDGAEDKPQESAKTSSAKESSAPEPAKVGSTKESA